MSLKTNLEFVEEIPESKAKLDTIKKAVKEIETHPKDIAEIAVSIYDKAWKEGFKLGLQMEARSDKKTEQVIEKKRSFWND